MSTAVVSATKARLSRQPPWSDFVGLKGEFFCLGTEIKLEIDAFGHFAKIVHKNEENEIARQKF